MDRKPMSEAPNEDRERGARVHDRQKVWTVIFRRVLILLGLLSSILTSVAQILQHYQ